MQKSGEQTGSKVGRSIWRQQAPGRCASPSALVAPDEKGSEKIMIAQPPFSACQIAFNLNGRALHGGLCRISATGGASNKTGEWHTVIALLKL
jgi:hypothetical protein